MAGSQGDKRAMGGRHLQDLRLYLTRRPVMLALLCIATVVFFVAVTGLSRIYHAQQDSLANRWFSRGVTDLAAHRYGAAVTEFRTALLYSRDDYSYQLNLAEALIGLKRTNEAYAYLINLWDREPENGLVNLELARIAAQKRETDQALRYYHNAIYATWPGDQEMERRDTRLELIDYLLKINAKPQAQAELIALAANLGSDPSQQARLGELFLQTRDYEHALAAYKQVLKSDPHNQPALAGAGEAAFQLGRYPLAQKYLEAAVAADPDDLQSIAQLKTTELVLLMDPFRRQISAAERGRIVVAAFSAAGDRLKSCSAPASTARPASSQPGLADAWTKMKPQINERGLRRNPDLVEQTMELVFNIERQTSATCGPPAGTDMALLLIARLHEGS
ncbi:MAG: tetratricopeptide repeat protein [Terriglobales bacterium]